MALFFHLGDEEHAKADLLFRTPAEGSRTVAGLASEAHSSLPVQPFFSAQVPAQTRLSKL